MPFEATGNRAGGSTPGVRPRLALSVVGPVGVSLDNAPLPIRGRKARAVIAYLALTEGLRESRERLVGLLWSEFDENRARTSLRQTLHELREHLNQAAFDGMHAERLVVWLDRATVQVDLWDVLDQAEAHQVHPLLVDVPRLTEALLQDLEDLDPAFRVWVLAKRQTVHDRLTGALAAGLRAEHLPRHTRRDIAAALLSLDPTHEEACRSFMQASAEAGDVAAALRAYSSLWDLLDADYDMEPGPATQQLVAEIKQGRFEAAFPEPEPDTAGGFRETVAQVIVPPRRPDTVPPAPPPPAKVALLVENYEMNGIDPDRSHLVQGFRHNLIASLVRFREWFVADGAAQPNLEQLGANVSATYTVAGTAYQAGSVINLVLTLRERGGGIYVWSDRFELRLDNWFEAQQQVIRRIAVSLNIHLSYERLTRLAGTTDVELEVYDRWLRGQEIINRFSPEHWNRAAQICAEMIEKAPSFSPAYSTLVQMNNSVHIIHPGLFRDAARAARTLELARTAVQLDPVDSRAQLCLGWSFAMSKQYAQAGVHIGLACELNPNDPWTLLSSALFHAFRGNAARADELWQMALDVTLAPNRTYWAYQVSIAFLRGDYEATIEAADHAADVIKTLPAWRAAALHYLGRQAEAAVDAQRFLAGIRDNWFGDEPASDAAIGRWLLHLYPISQSEHWEKLRAGVAGAGVPTGGIRHHDW